MTAIIIVNIPNLQKASYKMLLEKYVLITDRIPIAKKSNKRNRLRIESLKKLAFTIFNKPKTSSKLRCIEHAQQNAKLKQ